jgi:hypothetical protein
MRTSDGQCHGDRRKWGGPPRKRGGRKTESRQLGTQKQEGSTLEEFELPSLRRLARVCVSELEHVMNFRGLRLLKTAATPP